MKPNLKYIRMAKLLAMAYAAGYVDGKNGRDASVCDPLVVYQRLCRATVNGYCPGGFDEVCRMGRDIWQREVDLERKEKEQKND